MAACLTGDEEVPAGKHLGPAAADQLWDTHLGEGVPVAQRCHQLHAGQRGLVCHRL